MPRRHLLLLLCFLVSGCVSPPRKTPAPLFPLRLAGPVSLRMSDLRPEVQRGREPDAKWIYFRAQGREQSDLLVDYLGNALTVFNAASGYRVLDEDSGPSPDRVLIEIDYLEGYARWPVDLNQQGREIPVQGATHIRYRVFVDGKRVRRRSLKRAPSDFRVPVSIIRQDNVRQVVSDALAYQFDQATTHLLDDLLWDLAAVWPESY